MGISERRLVRWQLAILVTVGAVVAIAGFVAYNLVGEIHAVSQTVTKDAAEDLLDADAFGVASFSRSASARGYLLTGDESFLEERTAARAEMGRRLDRLRAREQRGDTAAMLDAIAELTSRLDHASDRALAARPNAPDEARALWEREARPIQDQVGSLTRQLIASGRAHFFAERDRATAAGERSTSLLAVLLVAAGLAIGVLLYAFARLTRALLARQRAEQEQTTFRLLDQVPVGVFVVSPDGKPYYANQYAQRILGQGIDPGLKLKDLSVAYHAYQAGTDQPYPMERTPLARALAGESTEVTDLEIRRGDDVIPLHVIGAPVFDARGELEYAVAGFQDVRELQRVATRDALTGLANRAAVSQTYGRERASSVRFNRSLAVALIDLDRFKAVNDTHGHSAGDDVLRRTASTIVEQLRRSDSVGRWGGEEIVVLMPDTDAQGARRALDKAAAAVRGLAFGGKDGRPFTVTFSAGVVVASPTESLDEVIARADALLYAAKDAGRDRVVVDPPPVTSGTSPPS